MSAYQDFITSFWITSTRYNVQPACKFLLRSGNTNAQIADINTYHQTYIIFPLVFAIFKKLQTPSDYQKTDLIAPASVVVCNNGLWKCWMKA